MPEQEKTEPPVIEELAGIEKNLDITRGFVDPLKPLTPTDSVLLTRGQGDYKVYEELKRDDQVFATWQQRTLAVVSRPYEVIPASDAPLDVAAADLLRKTLTTLNFDRMTEKMLNGRFYGYAVAECLWEQDGKNVLLKAVKVKKQRRFSFMPDGTLRLKKQDVTDGVPLPPRKFWTYSCGAEDDDEPYGIGLAHWLYWPVFFKRNDLKFWLMFLEKFGVATVLGKYRPGASVNEKEQLLEAAKALQTDAAVTIPDTMMLELLEAARSAGDQAEFYDRMNAAISKIVLSQTMTTDDGASLAQGTVHMTVRDELVRADADLVCESFNAGPARWLTDYNFKGANAPQVWRKMANDGQLKFRAELLKTVSEIGVARPTIDHIRDTFGGEWEPAAPAPQPFAAPAFGGRVAPTDLSPAFHDDLAASMTRVMRKIKPAPAFAENAQPDAPTTLAAQLEEAAAAVNDGFLNAVQTAFSEASDYEDLIARITNLIGDARLNPTQLATVLQAGFATAELSGRADVKDEGAASKRG
jgi:phage gp29-like protein